MDFENVVLPALILLIGMLVSWLSVRRILSLSTKVSRTWRRVAERIVLSVVVLLAVAVAGSATFNTIALLYFRANNPPPGDAYIVSGHKMHMYCTGSGSPTIVLDAEGGADALEWGGVQPELSKTTRVCAYDRAGQGWSDPLPAPRDADHIAAELHGLLLEAKITGPIVLMGHSIAGMYIRDYATRYPADVAGLIFVDTSTPFQDEDPAVKAAIAKKMPMGGMLLIRAVYAAGIPRLEGACSQPIPGFEAHAGKLLAEDSCYARWGAFVAEVFDSFNQSSQETVHTGPYGALPILIFSEDPAIEGADWPADVVSIGERAQEDLKKLSTRSRRIIAKGSTHQIPIDRADLIEKEVPRFIQQIRGTAPQPTNYGSTITE